LTSRAFYNDQLGPFSRDLAALAGMERVLPMNTGAEAVETAIKVARRWRYDLKGVPEEQAQIVVMTNNFHGRTTTVISFSNDHIARRGFGPFTPGFVAVPFGDAEAVAAAITPRTVAVLLEPVQGEAGGVRAAAGIPRGSTAYLYQLSRAVPCRRDPVGLGTVRDDLRLRTRGRRTRHLHVGQGARWRDCASIRRPVSK
jgi:acetylornithine/succinyldiaminopimelate/putrescine aminotransferase